MFTYCTDRWRIYAPFSCVPVPKTDAVFLYFNAPPHLNRLAVNCTDKVLMEIGEVNEMGILKSAWFDRE